MAAVTPSDILLRIGGATLKRLQCLASAGAARVEVPYTFTRADASTCATHVDRDGFIRQAAANLLRIEWVDLDGDGIRETPGILLEGSRTNGWDRSEELDHANWTKTNITVTANALGAPDGTTTADFLDEGVVNGFHYVQRATPTLTNNTRSVVTVFCRQTTGSRWLRILTVDKANTQRSTWFNPGTGVVGTVDGGHVTFIQRSALVSGGAFWRFGVSFDAASGATAPRVELYIVDVNGGGSYQGVSGSGLYLWGVDFEVDQAFPSSYIKTVASTVTRAADSFTAPFNFGPMDLTALIRVARPLHADAVGNLGLWPGIFTLSTLSADLTAFFNNSTRALLGEIQSGGNVNVNQSIPAGSQLQLAQQYRNLTSGGQVQQDVGTGFSGFSSAAAAFSAFGNQTLRLGWSIDGSGELYGVLLDLMVIRGLFSLAEMSAVP